MERILSFLKENPLFYFATVEGDKPRVRPFGAVLEHEGKLYFVTGTHKQTYKQLQANPNVEICTSGKGKWIRIRGTAVIDNSEAPAKKAFESTPFLRTIYNDETGYKLGMFYLADGEAEIADMQGYFEKFTF